MSTTGTGFATITPEWRAPRAVRAHFTLRGGGVSVGPFASLNLGARVGDRPDAVTENRRRVRSLLQLPAEPAWPEQVHGTRVIELEAIYAEVQELLVNAATLSVRHRKVGRPVGRDDYGDARLGRAARDRLFPRCLARRHGGRRFW